MSTTDDIGPGEEGLAPDRPETSVPGWDLEAGQIDDIGEGDEDLTDMSGGSIENPGPASLGDRNDPIENYVDDWPGEEAA